jgi:cytochrome c-type biogenesis protein
VDLTLGAALFAGLVSFLSPCVLPVVPAYLGQLGVIAAASPIAPPVAPLVPVAASGAASVAAPMRGQRTAGWRAMPNAIAFVAGFTLVFTILGATVYVVASPLRGDLPLLRQVGGVVLIVLGLNLMGVLRWRALTRSWKPLERFGRPAPGVRRGGVIGGFALGAAFGIGWTPCIGLTLSAILTLAAMGTSPQVVGLLVAYSIGLGVPFLLLALAIDRAPLVTRPLLRYSRQVEVVGGALVVVLGFALIFDWLGWFARSLTFLWPNV